MPLIYALPSGFTCDTFMSILIGLLLDLDSAYQGLIDDRSECDYVVAGGTGGLRKLLDHCLVHGAGSRDDVEVGQHTRAVDADVESSRTGCAEEGLCKMHPHSMDPTRI